MSMQNYWRAKPIFISSTFRDMQEERDYLRDIVFPEIEEFAREKKLYLEPVDLRWGVDTKNISDAEEKELMVLKVCLDEIDRCRPFIIVLLGDRYGWVPSKERMEEAVTQKGFDTEIEDKSVTALEIEYGVLKDKGHLERSFFYFRKPLPYDKMPPEIAAIYSEKYSNNPESEKAQIRLEALKERIIKEAGEDKVKYYEVQWDSKNNKITGLEEFGRLVSEDIKRILEEEAEEYSEEKPKTWQEEETKILKEFINEKTITFEGRKEFIKKLKNFALSQDNRNWGMVITGEAGSGKSVLMSKLYRELEDEDCLILAHAASISSRSNSIDYMLERWIYELAVYLDISDEEIEKRIKDKSIITLPDLFNDFPGEEITINVYDREDDLFGPKKELLFEPKKEAFLELLSSASSKIRVVLLMDALNQMERTKKVMYHEWLPEPWPVNARIIVTGIEGLDTQNLGKKAGITTVKMPSLNGMEAEAIIQSISKRYHKNLYKDITELLLEKRREDGARASTSPLWLNIAFNELLLLDRDDFERADTEEKLHSLLVDIVREMPPSVEELYRYVIDRAVKKFGEKYAMSVLKLVTVSRLGLREKDLKYLIPKLTEKPWNDLQFAHLRRYLRAHMAKRGEQGLWDFTHSQFRICMGKYYLNDEDEIKQINSVMADYLEGQIPDDPLRQTELMYHYYMADKKQNAAKYLASGLIREKFKSVVNTLKEIIVKTAKEKENKGLDWTVSLLKEKNLNKRQLREIQSIIFDLIKSLENNVALTVIIELTEKTLLSIKNLAKKFPKITDYGVLIENYNKLIDYYSQTGEKEKAIKYYEERLEVEKDLHMEVSGFEGLTEKARHEGADYLAESYYKLGNYYRNTGKLEKATNCYEKSLEFSKEVQMYIPDNTDYWVLSLSYYELGKCYQEAGKREKAGKYYEEFFKTTKELHLREPNNAGHYRYFELIYLTMGDYYLEAGEVEKAGKFFKQSLEIAKEIHKLEPDNADYYRDIAVNYEKLGNYYKESGEMLKASKYYEESLSIMEELYKQDPDNKNYYLDLEETYYKLSNHYLEVGEKKKAEKYNKKYYRFKNQQGFEK